MKEDFEKAEAEYQKAKARMDKFIVKRAKELYSGYDNYPENDDFSEWGGNGCMTREECRKHAVESLKAGQTAEETLAEWDRNSVVLRTVYLPKAVDEDLRILAFRSGRTKNDLMVDAIRVYFEALKAIEPDAMTWPHQRKGVEPVPTKPVKPRKVNG